MPYNVIFVGLVCFHKQSDGSRIALLPDGRKPPKGVDKHVPILVVDPASVMGGLGWSNDPRKMKGVFPLDDALVTMEGVHSEKPVDLDESHHKVTRLNKYAEGFRIAPMKAKTAARVPIRHGKLKSALHPAAPNKNEAAVVSVLNVSHGGIISIVLSGSFGHRTIVLEKGTNVVIANASGAINPVGNHFVLYGRLASPPVDMTKGTHISRTGMKVLSIDHVYFKSSSRKGVAKALGTECENTGCCP